jgi:CheY-like chemotaxis protein
MPLDTALSPASQPETPSAPAKPWRVLYIEDNPVNVMIVDELVSQDPTLSFRFAGTGQEGISLVRAWQPQLVLLDMQLPDMKGLSVFKDVRAALLRHGGTCIALSADAMPAHVEEALAEGLADYWTKPLDFELFRGAVARMKANSH